MDHDMILFWLAAAIIAGTPILFAALGEIMAERSGVLNLGVEGMMLLGAAGSFVVASNTGNCWLGLLAGMAGGALLALIHAVICITLRGNQVASGLALSIFGTGLSGLLGKNYQGMPLENHFTAFNIPLLQDIPILGPVLFRHDALVYLSWLAVIICWYVLYRTGWGLHIRAVGENPAAADSVGLRVSKIRYICTVLGGMLAGMGGAYLSLAYTPSWHENMTAGRGWIAVALVIFALWNPLLGLAGSYLFGGVDSLTFRMQTMGIEVSPFLLSMLPYILTIAVLVLVSIKLKHLVSAPSALGGAYDREER